ncbi:hypothetical protein [Litorihabitans aurantiacus]|uniref:GerMN domain-containing protein n=1 Tax=Litorihabitans aurantiacus TaxID=1930061 RepID=A0AA38CVZ6_9MICO|nr:hypothetical protein [Litorihabitans aurantiacus]GMA33175.1 hypothetical protein GCM10025875_31670 [Litorihabitans aurantiacus]
MTPPSARSRRRPRTRTRAVAALAPGALALTATLAACTSEPATPEDLRESFAELDDVEVDRVEVTDRTLVVALDVDGQGDALPADVSGILIEVAAQADEAGLEDVDGARYEITADRTRIVVDGDYATEHWPAAVEMALATDCNLTVGEDEEAAADGDLLATVRCSPVLVTPTSFVDLAIPRAERTPPGVARMWWETDSFGSGTGTMGQRQRLTAATPLTPEDEAVARELAALVEELGHDRSLTMTLDGGADDGVRLRVSARATADDVDRFSRVMEGYDGTWAVSLQDHDNQGVPLIELTSP